MVLSLDAAVAELAASHTSNVSAIRTPATRIRRSKINKFARGRIFDTRRLSPLNPVNRVGITAHV